MQSLSPVDAWQQKRIDLLAGLTVALALVPEAVAFAFVAGVHPLVGLYAAIIVVLITSILGGRPGMISAAAGSLAVVMLDLVLAHGVEYLFAAVILMGVFQLLIGFFKLGKFVRMVPVPVVLGFVNGLAIVIFLAQLKQFKTADGQWLANDALWTMLGVVAATMALVYLLPKITKAVPSALAAIVLVSLVVIFAGIETTTVGDLASVEGSLSGFFFGVEGEPQLSGFHLPFVPFTVETLLIILPYALVLTIIGTSESLMTMLLIDDITQTPGQGNRECVALGGANVVAGLFGTMGGCALIGQSQINVNSGARGRLSGISAGLGLMAIVLIASEYMEMIPTGALVGIMFVVVIATFNWASINLMRGMTRTDALVVVAVTLLTVVFDLAVAVVSGVIISALVFAWEHAQNLSVRLLIESHENGDEIKVYELHGPLFFASAHNFSHLFAVENDPDCVVADFRYTRVYDASGVEAIEKVTQRYLQAGKKLVLRHLSPECIALLDKAKSQVEINISEDPHYHVSLDR